MQEGFLADNRIERVTVQAGRGHIALLHLHQTVKPDQPGQFFSPATRFAFNSMPVTWAA